MDSVYLGIGTNEDTAFDNLSQLQEALQALANDTSGPCKDTVADAAAAVKRLGDLSGSDAEVDGYEWFFAACKAIRLVQTVAGYLLDKTCVTYQWAIDNPIKAGLIVVGVTIIVSPGLVTGPVVYGLELIGFTADGVAAGSIATAIQSMIGNVQAGSLFAASQSLGAGGQALAALTGYVQLNGMALVAGVGPWIPF